MNPTTTSSPTRLRRLLAVVAALTLLAGACGDSDEPADAGLGDLDIDLGDPELDDLIDDVLSDVNDELADDSDPVDPRFVGYRIWGHRRVEELLEGAPGNLAPNPFDEFAFEGPTFDLELGQPGTGGDIYLPTLVASYDSTWVIAGQGEQLARLDYPTNSVDVMIDAGDLAPEGEIVALLGDDDAIFAVMQLLDEAAIIEIDPATGAERGRTTVSSSGGRVTGADSNADWLTVSFSASAIPIPLIDRATLEVVDEIENLDNKAALLTDTDLAIVEGSSTASGGDALRLYDLSDRSAGELIEMPGNGTTRAFGNTVVQYDQNEGVVHGIAGAGPAIAEALAALESNNQTIGDIHIGDGFAIVQGCCADTADGGNQSLFVIDLGSGEILLTASANGTIVAPPA